MDFAAVIDGVESFAAYVGELASVIGHVGRVGPLAIGRRVTPIKAGDIASSLLTRSGPDARTVTEKLSAST
jgi:hypothetical protein